MYTTAGYACYFEGVDHIFKLSAGCWDSAYEVKDWTNIVSGCLCMLHSWRPCSLACMLHAGIGPLHSGLLQLPLP